jgi:hypothetical protein
MMVTPFHSPVRVKRRFTPPKAASALRIMASSIFSACATATAAVALSALWRPGIGSLKSEIVCAFSPSRPRMTIENCE